MFNVEKRKQNDCERYLQRNDNMRQRTFNNGEGSSQRPTDVINNVPETIISTNVEGSSDLDPYDFVYDGIPDDHRVLKSQTACELCGATRIQYEWPTFCCMSGKTNLAPSSIPHELLQLFTRHDKLGELFRSSVRAYNSNFSFASMGVNLDTSVSNMKSGVYTFRVQGTIYHRIYPLIPREGRPKYLQLYFFEGEEEILERLRWDKLDRIIVETLTRVLATNPYVRTLKRLCELGPLDKYILTFNHSADLDQRVYNQPMMSEVCILTAKIY